MRSNLNTSDNVVRRSSQHRLCPWVARPTLAPVEIRCPTDIPALENPQVVMTHNPYRCFAHTPCPWVAPLCLPPETVRGRKSTRNTWFWGSPSLLVGLSVRGSTTIQCWSQAPTTKSIRRINGTVGRAYLPAVGVHRKSANACTEPERISYTMLATLDPTLLSCVMSLSPESVEFKR